MYLFVVSPAKAGEQSYRGYFTTNGLVRVIAGVSGGGLGIVHEGRNMIWFDLVEKSSVF